jgi:hypothetical protein
MPRLHGTCTRCYGFAVAEARRLHLEGGQPLKRRYGSRPALVERAKHDGADVGDGVAGEQHAVMRQVDRDAAFGVARYRQDLGATAEVQRVTVMQLLHDRHGRRDIGQAG